MAQRRWLAPWRNDEQRPTFYHLINRVVDRRFVLGPEEKEKFRWYMRMVESFSGCRVLSYCVMSNHFHLLLEVPPRIAAVGDCRLPDESDEQSLGSSEAWPGIAISEEEFFVRLRELYSEAAVESLRGEVTVAREANRPEEVSRIFARYAYRMHDLSEFMKTLTQRFSSWFNRTHERKGRLWEQRFKSIIVEDGLAARTMAAYIDMNPVRAGIVNGPADYRWSSYGEALAGGLKACAGLVRALRGFDFEGSDEGKSTAGEATLTLAKAWTKGRIAQEYQALISDEVLEKTVRAEVTKSKGPEPLSREEASQSDNVGSSVDLAISQVIRSRIRYFSDGVVIGGKEFVDEVFRESRNRFGVHRRSGARKPRGTLAALGKSLWTVRDLQKEV